MSRRLFLRSRCAPARARELGGGERESLEKVLRKKKNRGTEEVELGFLTLLLSFLLTSLGVEFSKRELLVLFPRDFRHLLLPALVAYLLLLSRGEPESKRAWREASR